MTTMTTMARDMGAWNETTGKDYQGGNVTRLTAVALDRGYDLMHGWAGFQQWLSVGRVVRKGEKGTACLTVVEVDKDPKTGKGGTRKPRGFRVFHFDQTEVLTPKAES